MSVSPDPVSVSYFPGKLTRTQPAGQVIVSSVHGWLTRMQPPGQFQGDRCWLRFSVVDVWLVNTNATTGPVSGWSVPANIRCCICLVG